MALAPFNFWPIAIPCIAVLFYKLQHQTVKQALVKAGVFGFAMFFAGVSWVYISIHEHGFIPGQLRFSVCSWPYFLLCPLRSVH